MTKVVAALIKRQERILICCRRQNQEHPGKWEFPGGKIEQGETPHQALSRELREELGVDVKPDREITRYKYQYPGQASIELTFFHVEDTGQVINANQFSEIRWVPASKLPSFDFLAGNMEFIDALVRGKFRQSDEKN